MLELPPFPTLEWSGFSWSAPVILPGFRQDGPVDMEVRVPPPAGPVREEAARPPSVQQAAAYRFLLDDGPGVWAALLTAVRDRVAKWSEWPLDHIAGAVVLSRVTIHVPAWDGAAYVGYWLSPSEVDTWLTEHGAGVTAHRYRVAAVGMGEEACSDAPAASDLRRLKRSHKGLPPRRG